MSRFDAIQDLKRGKVKLGNKFFALVTGTFFVVLPVFSQATSVTPVPIAFRTAKSVFVSNAGNDRAYVAFYQALSGWNKYRLAADPGEADIAFEISYGVDDSTVTRGDSYQSPYLNLVSRDVKTHIVLWSITESMGRRTGDKDFAATASKLVEDLRALYLGEIPSQSIATKKK